MSKKAAILLQKFAAILLIVVLSGVVPASADDDDLKTIYNLVIMDDFGYSMNDWTSTDANRGLFAYLAFVESSFEDATVDVDFFDYGPLVGTKNDTNSVICCMSDGTDLLLFFYLADYGCAFYNVEPCIIDPSTHMKYMMEGLCDGGYKKVDLDDVLTAAELIDSIINTDSSDTANTPTESERVRSTDETRETVLFGTYEQDNNTINGKEDIEWLVLEKDEDKALLISKKALNCHAFNESEAEVTWESCSFRKWLNGEFLENAFSPEEQAKILSTTVTADQNPQNPGDAGNATTDKIFLLSITEAEKYFPSGGNGTCTATEYAKAQGTLVFDDYKTADGEDACWWWLRSPGIDQLRAAYIQSEGFAYYDGAIVNYPLNGVRPVLWINLGDADVEPDFEIKTLKEGISYIDAITVMAAAAQTQGLELHEDSASVSDSAASMDVDHFHLTAYIGDNETASGVTLSAGYLDADMAETMGIIYGMICANLGGMAEEDVQTVLASIDFNAFNTMDSSSQTLIFNGYKVIAAVKPDDKYCYQLTLSLQSSNNAVTVTPTEAPVNINIGKLVEFGTYEQDNDSANGKEAIEWTVIDVDKNANTATLLSVYALDVYNTYWGSSTWDNSTLRTWMNGTFYESAFTAEEKEIIVTSTVAAEKNPNYSSDAGKDTQDKVFALSYNEANNLLNNSQRRCQPTAYAEEKRSVYIDGTGNCYWWLRSPGKPGCGAAIVCTDGSYDYDASYDGFCYGMRPAVKVDLSALASMIVE